MSNQASTSRVSVAEIQVVYLTQGIEAVKDMEAKLLTLKKAESQLCARGVDTTSLLGLIDSLSVTGGKRGKTPHTSGTRSFTVQQNSKTGARFIILPMEALNVQKGDKVNVTVNGDYLTVMV